MSRKVSFMKLCGVLESKSLHTVPSQTLYINQGDLSVHKFCSDYDQYGKSMVSNTAFLQKKNHSSTKFNNYSTAVDHQLQNCVSKHLTLGQVKLLVCHPGT